MFPYPVPNVLPNVLESQHQPVPAATIPWAARSISKAQAPVGTFGLSSLVASQELSQGVMLRQLFVQQRSAVMGRGLRKGQQLDILLCSGSGHCARIMPLLNGK